MKNLNLKRIVLLPLVLFFALNLFASERNIPDNFDFDVQVDFAYYPLSNHIETGLGSPEIKDFIPLSGIYSGLEGRAYLSGSYTIPTPLGNHWLVNGAKIALRERLEVSPVSVMPISEISFTPVPFLVFNSGFQVGTGWDLGNVFTKGMSVYSPTAENSNAYKPLSPFANLYTKYWIQGTFQFDTGAIFEGDWTHIQMMYTYQTFYEGLTGVEDKTVWGWQCTGNKVNGLKEYQQAILAYAMPLTLSRVGIVFQSERYYRDDVYANKNYKASEPELDLSAMGQISFSPKDNLTILVNFRGRKKFETYKPNVPESRLNTNGREWFFRRIALSYTHNF